MKTPSRPWFLTRAAVATRSGCSLSLDPVDTAIEELMKDDALASSTPSFLSAHFRTTGDREADRVFGKRTAAG